MAVIDNLHKNSFSFHGHDDYVAVDASQLVIDDAFSVCIDVRPCDLDNEGIVKLDDSSKKIK
jgi:hypothetical protein